MNRKKKIVRWIVLCVVLTLGLYAVIYKNNLIKKYTTGIELSHIQSLSFESYTSLSGINDVNDQETIDIVTDYLKQVTFDGLILENEIQRSGDQKICCLKVLTENSGVCEIQLTTEDIDKCYIRPYKGLFSEGVYLKISNCSKLYDYVYTYIVLNQ